MSVSLINRTDLNKAMNTISKNLDIQYFVKQSDFFEEYNKFGVETVETFIGRALWYGYIANITAWNVQYEENEQIDFSDFSDDLEFENLQEAISILDGLVYNIFTNNGTCFLQQKWLNLLDNIIKNFQVIEEPEIPSWCY